MFTRPSFLLDGLVGVAFLAGLDEVGVLGKAGAVHHDGHTVLVAEFAGLLDVLHGNGLTTHGVVGHGEYHEGHVTLVLAQHLLQLLERYVALEGDFELGVLGLVDGDVDGLGLTSLDVTLGGVEVGVAGDDVAFLHQIGEQHVLGCTALVGGDDILETEDALYDALKLVERGGTGVTLVTQHHLGPLAVAHRTGTGMLSLEHENVVVSFLEPLFTLGTGALAKGLDHLDFPRFSKW